MPLNEQGFPERKRGPNGEQITVCDRKSCHNDYEIARILGTRKGYKWQWNKDGQREWLVSMPDYPTIEWLTDAEVAGDKEAKKALVDRFKKDMGWASLSSELGKEFCVPADKKPKKAAPSTKRGPGASSASVARKKRAAPRPRATGAARKASINRKPSASTAASSQAGQSKDQRNRKRPADEGTQQLGKDTKDSRGGVKRPRSDADNAQTRRMFELGRKMHDFTSREDRRITALIEYLVSMKYKADDHQFLRECLGHVLVDGVNEDWLVYQTNLVPAGKKVVVEYYNSVCTDALDIINRDFRALRDDVGQGPSNRAPSVTALLNKNLVRRVEAYLLKLGDADLPVSQALKEAVVWEVVSDALTYENDIEKVRARISQFVREEL